MSPSALDSVAATYRQSSHSSPRRTPQHRMQHGWSQLLFLPRNNVDAIPLLQEHHHPRYWVCLTNVHSMPECSLTLDMFVACMSPSHPPKCRLSLASGVHHPCTPSASTHRLASFSSVASALSAAGRPIAGWYGWMTSIQHKWERQAHTPPLGGCCTTRAACPLSPAASTRPVSTPQVSSPPAPSHTHSPILHAGRKKNKMK